MQIRLTKEEGRKLILILPVGPMGMYKWAVYFLKEWNVDCKHVYGFNMDEWADAEGNTLPASDPAAFQNAMTGSRTFARDYASYEDWKAAGAPRLARLHPFTIDSELYRLTIASGFLPTHNRHTRTKVRLSV